MRGLPAWFPGLRGNLRRTIFASCLAQSAFVYFISRYARVEISMRYPRVSGEFLWTAGIFMTSNMLG
jgi:hypothetical protein